MKFSICYIRYYDGKRVNDHTVLATKVRQRWRTIEANNKEESKAILKARLETEFPNDIIEISQVFRYI